MKKTQKQHRVRARLVLGNVFKAVKKLDDGASPEAIASTVLDHIEDGDPDKVIRIGKIAELVGLSTSEIKRRWKMPNSDFPKPVELGGTGKTRRVGCREAEVRRWLRKRTRV